MPIGFQAIIETAQLDAMYVCRHERRRGIGEEIKCNRNDKAAVLL